MSSFRNSYAESTIVGRLAENPTLSKTPRGTSVTTLSVAVTEETKNGDQKQKNTQYITVSVYGQLADILCTALRILKGDMILVNAKFFSRQKDMGEYKFNYFELIADSVTPLVRSEANRQANQGGYQQPAAPQQGGYQQPAAAHAPQQGGYQQPVAAHAPQQGGYQQPAAAHAPQQGGYQQPAAAHAPQQGGYQQPAAPQQRGPMEPPIDFDDDIPF